MLSTQKRITTVFRQPMALRKLLLNEKIRAAELVVAEKGQQNNYSNDDQEE